MKLKMIKMDENTSGGQKVGVRECVFDTDSYKDSWGSEAKLMLIKLKTMDQLIKENSDYFFDCYGNLNTGSDHLAPSYFSCLGHTIHRHYLPENGIPKSTWYYDVIDY